MRMLGMVCLWQIELDPGILSREGQVRCFRQDQPDQVQV